MAEVCMQVEGRPLGCAPEGLVTAHVSCCCRAEITFPMPAFPEMHVKVIAFHS